MLICGSLLLTLTGIFPEKYDANNRTDGMLEVLYLLHLAGVFGSGVLLLCVCRRFKTEPTLRRAD